MLRKCIEQAHVQRQKLWSKQSKLKAFKVKLATVKSPRQRKPDHSDDAAFCETKFAVLNIRQHWSIKACWLSAILKPLNDQRVLPNQHQEKPKNQIVQLER